MATDLRRWRLWVVVWAALLGGVARAGETAVGEAAAGEAAGREMTVLVRPATPGRQLIRTSLPFPRMMVREGETLLVRHEGGQTEAAVRPLTWHAGPQGSPRSVRRALVSLPYSFASAQPVRLVVQPGAATTTAAATEARPPTALRVDGQTVTIVCPDDLVLKASLLAPNLSAPEAPRVETVESNACFLWQRFHWPDPQWPRVIEARVDVLGTVVLVAHVQRNLPGDGRAPDLGWEVTTAASPARLHAGDQDVAVQQETVTHTFKDSQPCALLFGDGAYRLYHPTAHFKRRGRVEVRQDDARGLRYRYWRCTAEEKVPMQQSAWHRAELVVSPAGQALLTPTLEYAHQVEVDGALWDELYGVRRLPILSHPSLSAVLNYHHEAIVRSLAWGDDWGNVTGYSDGSATGSVFGMNRLNHCPAIFQEGLRCGDRRLLETAVLWCDNVHDQSIWWGPDGTGGTRYNNIVAMGKTPPDNDQSYMWRSNRAVNFCTKGYDSFFMAYEQTGDPRMMEALEVQVAYAAQNVFVDRGECRNIGDVADFVRLYEFTGQRRHLDGALRLFRELRTKLSTGDLFSQGGQPLDPDPPFIEDDKKGYDHPFAKPYIIGYALAGLPALARHAPDEPKLRDMVQAVAEFLARSQDPVGGWRYPHPASSNVLMSQAMEHAWQLVQAAELLGPRQEFLDAIEKVLRQRIAGWQKTGQTLSGLTGWEHATGKVKTSEEMDALYKRPADRDPRRDYVEGRLTFGSSPPEGLVYFPEVLAYYLRHRPESRLIEPPKEDDPLGKVLQQVPGGQRCTSPG